MNTSISYISKSSIINQMFRMYIQQQQETLSLITTIYAAEPIEQTTNQPNYVRRIYHEKTRE